MHTHPNFSSCTQDFLRAPRHHGPTRNQHGRGSTHLAPGTYSRPHTPSRPRNRRATLTRLTICAPAKPTCRKGQKEHDSTSATARTTLQHTRGTASTQHAYSTQDECYCSCISNTRQEASSVSPEPVSSQLRARVHSARRPGHERQRCGEALRACGGSGVTTAAGLVSAIFEAQS